MAPLAVDMGNSSDLNIYKQASYEALYNELEKGFQGVQDGEVYTIEEAWEEIDKIK